MAQCVKFSVELEYLSREQETYHTRGKMTAFWDVVPYSVIEIDQSFRAASIIMATHPVDGGNNHL
jgi:hypothetical protein